MSDETAERKIDRSGPIASMERFAAALGIITPITGLIVMFASIGILATDKPKVWALALVLTWAGLAVALYWASLFARWAAEMLYHLRRLTSE